ncbi:MAG: hypothetical protein GY820_47835 [Gammaproteobacteria bacterium]|nr:hypothetical protein [Gammaproteobacteria bacterium]
MSKPREWNKATTRAATELKTTLFDGKRLPRFKRDCSKRTNRKMSLDEGRESELRSAGSPIKRDNEDFVIVEN